MAFTTGNPADDNTAYTIVIPRVFGDNGHRKGVSNDDVHRVISSHNWGLLQGIDCHEKSDFRTGEKFRMMFVRWTEFNPPQEIKKTLEEGGHIEIDIDDYGHFWKLRKFVPRVKTNKQNTTMGVRTVSKTGNTANLNKWSVLEVQDTNTINDNTVTTQDTNTVNHKDFPVLGQPKDHIVQGVWDTNSEFKDEMDAFCESGLSVQELSIADELQDSFDKMLQQNLDSSIADALQDSFDKMLQQNLDSSIADALQDSFDKMLQQNLDSHP